MLCDNCKKRTATVHITKITNHQKTERHLCEQCARQTGEINAPFNASLSVNDFLKGLFATGFEEAQLPVEPTCARCGMSYSDFSRSGKIGCSACYKTFKQRIRPLVKRIHGTYQHTGKIPVRCGGILALKQQLQRLKEQLQRHVQREEYEEAARLRDQIHQLEKEIAGKQ